jgi:hypothetical protein
MCINRRTKIQSLRYTCKASYFASKEYAIDENVAWNHDERREFTLNLWFYIFIINVTRNLISFINIHLFFLLKG